MNALWPDVWSRQRFLVAEVLAHVDFLDESIERLSAEIAERERTFEVVLDRYGTVRPRHANEVESLGGETLGSTTFARQSNATSRLRGRLRLRWLVGSFVGMVLLCGLVYVGICSYMAVSLTRVERHPFTRSPETQGLAYESVDFPSRIDAISLNGWLLPASVSPARLPVIVVHGKGSDRQAEAGGHTLDITAQLVRDGHPVLLFDLRGSGRSGGDRFTLGAQEVRDVGGAIDFLTARGLADNGVDALGFSMGASTTLIVASNQDRVRAIAEDSGYATLGSILEDQVPKASGLPGFFTAGMVFMARPLLGIDASAIRPVDGMPSLAAQGTRLLVIHGDADQLVPVSNGRALAVAYGPAAETYFVPGAGHVASYATDPSTYMARLISFLDGADNSTARREP